MMSNNVKDLLYNSLLQIIIKKKLILLDFSK